VTPFLSMARSLDPASDYRIDLYYCVKSLAEAHFLDDFNKIAERCHGLRIILFRDDLEGFITAGEIGETSGPLGHRDILICGPPSMIDSLTSQYTQLGMPRGQLHFEKFGFIPQTKPRSSRLSRAI
jgi:ferredoxin-NADP reductase